MNAASGRDHSRPRWLFYKAILASVKEWRANTPASGEERLETRHDSCPCQAGNPLPYQQIAFDDLQGKLEIADKEWSEAEEADSTYQKQLGTVRRKADAFDRELQAFRRSLAGLIIKLSITIEFLSFSALHLQLGSGILSRPMGPKSAQWLMAGHKRQQLTPDPWVETIRGGRSPG